MGFFPQTPSFTNLSFVEPPDPLTGHGYLLHTLHVFVGTRALTFVQKVPLPSACTSDCLSSSVGNLMGFHSTQRLPLALRAARSLLIYPAGRIESDGRPPLIQWYKMGSNESGLWYWNATTQVASDDLLSQRRGWRGVLSFSFKDRVR